MQLIVFIVATLMVLVGAVGVIVRKHPVHAALSLILTLFGIAVHFVALEANFLAAVQVIVYAGAIVVLFLFVIMLLGVDASEDLRTDPIAAQRPLGAIVAVGILALVGTSIIVSRGILKVTAAGKAVKAANNLRDLARSIFSDYVFAFELTSVLLVIAVVGTVLLARKLPKPEPAVKS